MQDWAKGLMDSKKRGVLPIMTHPGIEMIGREVYDAVTDGRVHYEAIKAVNEAYPQSAAATVIMDLTVEAEAFGSEISFPKNEVPSVIGRLVSDYASVEKLQVPDLTKGRVQQYLLANKLAAENITDKPTLAGCIGPFSPVRHDRDYDGLLRRAGYDRVVAEEMYRIHQELLPRAEESRSERCSARRAGGRTVVE